MAPGTQESLTELMEKRPMTIVNNRYVSEPYRLFFPLGFAAFLAGIFLWVPQIWNPGPYPVLLHRYLLLNGFTASFIGGFLMTAVPRFSSTAHAKAHEALLYLIVTLAGLYFALNENEKLVYASSIAQPLTLLAFMVPRILKRKQNPPYSFIFIFVGFFLWIASGISAIFFDSETGKDLHYEGAIAAIILGVGSRLIPGILGHVEIVTTQRDLYEKPVALLKTVPLYFFGLILVFALSYLPSMSMSAWLRFFVVFFIAYRDWETG